MITRNTTVFFILILITAVKLEISWYQYAYLDPRTDSSTVVVGDELFVFGGKGVGYFNDLWKLDLNYYYWYQSFSVQSSPPRRSGAAITQSKNQFIYIFGGYDGTSYFNDMWMYKIDAEMWIQIPYLSVAPSVRTQAAMAIDDDSGIIYLFGGRDLESNNELWTFNTITNVWKLLSKQQVNQPSARYAHTMSLENGLIYLHGGVEFEGRLFLHLGSNQWFYSIADEEWLYIDINQKLGFTDTSTVINNVAYETVFDKDNDILNITSVNLNNPDTRRTLYSDYYPFKVVGSYQVVSHKDTIIFFGGSGNYGKTFVSTFGCRSVDHLPSI